MRRRRPGTCVNSDDPSRQPLLGRVPKTRALEEREERVSLRECQDGLGEVGICNTVCRDSAADQRKNASKVEKVKCAEGKPCRAGEFEDDGLSSGPKHTIHFRQPCEEIVEIPHPEGNRDRIEAFIVERKVMCICRLKPDPILKAARGRRVRAPGRRLQPTSP